MYLAAKKNPMVLQPPTAKAATAVKAVEKKVEQKVEKKSGVNGYKPLAEGETITFKLNGSPRIVPVREVGPGMSLATYIREVALLTGTKISCNEGGCGTCIVTVKKSENDAPRSLNSCLCPVLICDGWEVTTVEGLGNRHDGYHPIQSKLAEEGGTQCGYCSPGMVMQLYSWLQEHPNATKMEIDNILDGNICRCTGYRPILEAFKSFAADNSDFEIPDIEELKLCKKSGMPCSGTCAEKSSCGGGKSVGEFLWYSPTTISELASVLQGLDAGVKYKFISGNLATGVYKNDGPFDAFINLNKCAELTTIGIVADDVTFGANVKITDAINAMETTDNEVWRGVAHHMRQIASYGVRNQGSLAGNLMMKHYHNDFPSDVFLSLETAGAQLEIMDHLGAMETVPLNTLPTMNMDRKLIVRIKITLQAMKDQIGNRKREISHLWMSRNSFMKTADAGEWVYRSFKIMPRSSNAHAYVNAGFLAFVDKPNSKLLNRPRIVFGGISSTFIHASATESFLEGRELTQDIFLEALGILAEELILDEEPGLASPVYRKQLALSLFYKFWLYMLGDKCTEDVRSGAYELDRGVTSGQQDFETDEAQWPISKPVEKYEAKIQTAGEAEFVNDIPSVKGELNAAFVLSTVANCDIVGVDTTKALAMSGVIAYVDASDIPGQNSWKFASIIAASVQPEPVFAAGRSEYAGQAIGLIVAETRDIAIAAAKLVKVTYDNFGPVVTDIEEAIKDPSYVFDASMGFPMQYGDVTTALQNAAVVVSGRFKIGAQYHFYMETHVCIAKPTDDGLELELPTQDMATVSDVVSKVLNVSSNSINIQVKRLGGAYGGKIELPTAVASAVSVAATKLRQPVRLWVNMEDTMCMFGKRTPYLFDYQIGFDASKKIVGVKSDMYCDGGWSPNGVDAFFAQFFGQSCYHIPNLKFGPFGVKTHTQATTATRAPGSPIMPVPEVLEEPNPIGDMIEKVKQNGDYASRVQEIQTFNQVKISLAAELLSNLKRFGIKYHCLISVFAGDGTISVTHSGIEMGQGLNTKVQQVIASELGVDINIIKIKNAMNVVSPNATVTGGSFGSELNCAAAIEACKILNGRLSEVKKKAGAAATWLEIVQAANMANVDLCARYMFTPDRQDAVNNYSIWGVVLTEVEVDILTGEKHIKRCDLIEDAGLSTSPLVDIGQIEGAFMMGAGLWTSEEIKFHPQTGELLTKNTWEYKPPAAKDIPQDFRVTLLKNSRNPRGVLGSKATGEPALLLAISVLFAIRSALDSSRTDNGLTPGWWRFDGPATVEKIHQHAGINPLNFTF